MREVTRALSTTTWLAVLTVCLGAGLAGCGGADDADAGAEYEPGSFRITSPAFADGEAIPARYTCDGEDGSPPLEWENVPPGTKALVLICSDPDAPAGTWDHWILYNMDPEIDALPAGTAADSVLFGRALHGLNSWRKAEYGGPCPPRGAPHRYFFSLYALYAELDLPTGASREDLLEAMAPMMVGKAVLMGTYGRE